MFIFELNIKNFFLTKKQKKLKPMIKKLILFFLLLSPLFADAQDLVLVRNKQGKYGFVDNSGDTIIECKYDYAENFSGGLALVKNNLRYKIIDTSGRMYNIDQYDGSNKFRLDLGEYHTGLPILIEQWDCAYINSSGDVYLKIPYLNAESFVHGKAKVFEGDRYNYISKNGILLDSWLPVDDDYHAIKDNGKFGYIDKNGKLVIDYKFVGAKDFKNGYAEVSNGTYWALIDKKGKRISDWYEQINDFKGNLAIVKKLDNVGFINRSGKFMGQWYKTIEPLKYGLYKVYKYEKYALVNSEGYIVSQWFDKIYNFKNGYLEVEKEGKYAFVNKIGAMVIGWYDKIGKIVNGIIKVENNGKYGFYNVESFYISNFYDSLGVFHDGWAIVKNKGKYTFIGKKGNLMSKFTFDKCYDFENKIAKVEKDKKAAYISDSGKIIMGWYKVRKYYQKEPPKGLIVVKYGRKYGFETLNGRRIIPAKFDYAENFSEGLALVKNNPKKMYVTKEGKLVDPAKADKKNIRYDLGYGHSGAPVEKTKWNCAYIDYSGDIVLNLDSYDDAGSFVNGKARVVKNDKYNFINKKGKLIGNWHSFVDNYHAKFENGKFGFIDKNGNTVIPYKFDYAEDFKNGIAKVRIGDRKTGKYAYINLKGQYKTKLYQNLTDFKNNIAYAENNNKYVLIDTSGKEISLWYDKIFPFHEGMAKVEKNGKYTFINIKGKQFDKWFDNAGNFVAGRAKIEIKGKWGFVDKNGEIVVKPIYDNVWNYYNNIAKIEKNGKYAFIDLNGRLVTEWFDRLYMFSEGRAVFAKNKKWGYIDVNGHIVVKPIYDRAFAYSGGYGLVLKNGKMFKIDYKGNIIDNNSQQN